MANASIKSPEYDQGFALIEVIVALVIMAMAAVSIGFLFIRNYATVSAAGRQSEMLFLARENMESKIINAGEDPENDTILQISFDNLDEPIQVPGKIITITQEYDKIRSFNNQNATNQGENGQEVVDGKGLITLETFIYDASVNQNND